MLRSFAMNNIRHSVVSTIWTRYSVPGTLNMCRNIYREIDVSASTSKRVQTYKAYVF